MLTLALDTSSDSGSIAVFREGRLIALVSTTTEETYSSRIFRQLQYLLAELSHSLSQFDLVAVNAGPGSFTGLRVGLTLAKAWAEVHDRPVAAVSGLEAVAAQAHSNSEFTVAVLDARRGQMYAAAYRRPSDALGGLRLVAESENVVVTPQEFLVWLRSSPERSRAVIATTSVAWFHSVTSGLSEVPCFTADQIQQVSHVLAPAIGLVGHQQFARGEAVDALHVDANYVRRSDAELNWKGK